MPRQDQNQQSPAQFISDSTCLICDEVCETSSEALKHVQVNHADLISEIVLPENIDQIDSNSNLESETLETSEIPKTKVCDGGLNPRSNKPKKRKSSPKQLPDGNDLPKMANLNRKQRSKIKNPSFENEVKWHKKIDGKLEPNYEIVEGEREGYQLYALDGFLHVRNQNRTNTEFFK